MPDKLRPSWIAFGWFIAAAVTALLVLALNAIGAISAANEGDGVWIPLAITIGFFVGGFFAGSRAGGAAVAHGIGIGLFSLLVWGLANLLIGEPADSTAWSELSVTSTVTLLLLQAVAAVVGARAGVRWSRRSLVV